MKKFFLPCLLTLLLGLVGGLLYNFFALGGTGLLPARPLGTSVPASPITVPNPPPTSPPAPRDPADRAYLLERGGLVLAAMQEGDYETLAAFVHPERGVTFTAFSTVSKSDLTLTANQVAGAAENESKYIWGIAHGSGTPLDLTIQEYFAAYVISADYSTAPLIGVNYVSASGNSLENVAEAYPDDVFLEYYFPGTDSASSGLDWSALKLVFGAAQGELKLVGIIHSEWTI